MMVKRITSQYLQPIYNLAWLVAKDEGLFEREGLDVTFFKGDTGRPTAVDVRDPNAIDSLSSHVVFEEGTAQTYSACEWGQVRRSYDTRAGGRIAMQRTSIVSQALLVRPESGINDPHELRNKSIAVNFHAGSHYMTLQVLEGFMERDAINVVHFGGPQARLQALLDGRVDAAVVMEPFISLGLKGGCQIVIEAFLNGSEISSPEIDQETFDALNRALTEAVRRINADKRGYIHYITDDIPAEMGPLSPEEFDVNRIRCVPPRPYPMDEFERAKAWMVSWGLLAEDACYEDLVDNRVGALT
jgi:NitT/TauT family transport system substrate-binding protein